MVTLESQIKESCVVNMFLNIHRKDNAIVDFGELQCTLNRGQIDTA